MGEKRRNGSLLSAMNVRAEKERESKNATTKQKHAKPNGCQIQMSHEEQHRHDKSSSQPFPRRPRTHDSLCAAPPQAVDKMFHLLDSKQPKPAVFGYSLASPILPVYWQVSEIWGRGCQMGSGEMAKHKPYKFACTTLRLEKPSITKMQHKKTQSRRTKEI